MKGPRHVYKQYIRATPEAIWSAITDPAQTNQYFYSSRVASTWEPNADIDYLNTDDTIGMHGTILEIDPPRKLIYTFEDRIDPRTADERPSRVTWEIEPVGEVCAVTLIHDDFDGETVTYRNVGNGWPKIFSNLKTLLETGAAFPM